MSLTVCCRSAAPGGLRCANRLAVERDADHAAEVAFLGAFFGEAGDVDLALS
jgi:hypothetical protein